MRRVNIHWMPLFTALCSVALLSLPACQKSNGGRRTLSDVKDRQGLSAEECVNQWDSEKCRVKNKDKNGSDSAGSKTSADQPDVEDSKNSLPEISVKVRIDSLENPICELDASSPLSCHFSTQEDGTEIITTVPAPEQIDKKPTDEIHTPEQESKQGQLTTTLHFPVKTQVSEQMTVLIVMDPHTRMQAYKEQLADRFDELLQSLFAQNQAAQNTNLLTKEVNVGVISMATTTNAIDYFQTANDESKVISFIKNESAEERTEKMQLLKKKLIELSEDVPHVSGVNTIYRVFSEADSLRNIDDKDSLVLSTDPLLILFASDRNDHCRDYERSNYLADEYAHAGCRYQNSDQVIKAIKAYKGAAPLQLVSIQYKDQLEVPASDLSKDTLLKPAYGDAYINLITSVQSEGTSFALVDLKQHAEIDLGISIKKVGDRFAQRIAGNVTSTIFKVVPRAAIAETIQIQSVVLVLDNGQEVQLIPETHYQYSPEQQWLSISHYALNTSHQLNVTLRYQTTEGAESSQSPAKSSAQPLGGVY